MKKRVLSLALSLIMTVGLMAVNGTTGSEAFLAAALFGKMDASDQLTPYRSAAEAAQAVDKVLRLPAVQDPG